MSVAYGSDVCHAVAEQLCIPVPEITRIVDAYLAEVQRKVSKGTRVTIIGFGAFEAKNIKGREIQNNFTEDPDDKISFEDYKRVAFTTGSEFKRLVNS